MTGQFEILDELVKSPADEERKREKTELHCVSQISDIGSLGVHVE